MRLFMQSRAEGSEAPRYYQIVLQQDLLGGWTLFREWGHQGGRASSRREARTLPLLGTWPLLLFAYGALPHLAEFAPP